MTVYLKLFGGLRRLLPREPTPYPADVPAGATVADVFAAFGVPAAKARIVLVNGRHVERDLVLTDGDRLSVFPPVAGG